LSDLDARLARRWTQLAPVLPMALFLLIYPYHRGLYYTPVALVFEGPLYGAMIWLSAAFAVWALLLPFPSSETRPEYGKAVVRAEENEVQGRKKLRTLLAKHPYIRQLAPFAVFLLPLSFFVSSWNAASPHSATMTFMIWTAYAFVFLMVYHTAREPLARMIFSSAVGLSGTAIVIFGFMNYFGDASLWGMIQYTGKGGVIGNTYNLAVDYGASGLRLTSVFQYANAYAAFLIGFFLLLMAAITHARKSWVAALAALPVVPALLAFLLTQSRGGYLMLPVASLLFLALIRTHRQLVFLVLSVLAGLLAVLLYGPIFNIGLQAVQQGFDPSMPLRGWTLLIPVSAGFTAAVFLIHRFAVSRLEIFIERRIRFRGRQLLLPLAGILLGATGIAILLRGAGLLRWLPEALSARLEAINLAQHSVLERWTFYRDIFKMIRDYPWFGAGGHSWAALYGRYQNNPYTSNDPHSFYLQYILDTGIIGFVLFAAFLSFCLASGLRKAFRLRFDWDAATPACFGMLLGLAVHSAIDLDMNFMYLGILFFLGLAVFAAPVPAEQAAESAGIIPASSDPSKADRTRTKDSDKRDRKKARRRTRMHSADAIRFKRATYGVAAACFAAVLALGIVAALRLNAHNTYLHILREADRTEGDIEVFDGELQKALKIVPGNPFYLAQRAGLMLQLYESTRSPQFLRQAEEAINRYASAEPNRRDVVTLQIRLALARGDQEEALEAVESGLAKFPWDMELYGQAFELHYALGTEAARQGDREARRRHFEAILNWRDVIEARIAHLATLPEGQIQGRPFAMTQRMKNILTRVQNEI